MEQFNIFQEYLPKFTFPKGKTIKIGTFFSGIGTPEMASEEQENKFEVVFRCEIDKYPNLSYNEIHGDVFNYNDITKIESIPYVDILHHSPPCQDLSKAGKQRGAGKGTRSGLMYETLRIVKNSPLKPQVIIMEQVPDLIQVNFKHHYHEVFNMLEEMGYSTYAKVLNAKDYGVAQNRNRLYMVSILGNYTYDFPKPIPLTKRLKDYLEDEVDEKYYLSDKILNFFQENSKKNEQVGNGFRFKPKSDEDVAVAITTRSGGRMDDNFLAEPLCNYDGRVRESRNTKWSHITPTIPAHSSSMPHWVAENKELIQVAQMYGTEKEPNPQAGRIYDSIGISPTLDSMQGGNRMPKIAIPEATQKGYAVAEEGDGVYINRPEQKRGVVQKGLIQTIKTSSEDVGVVVKQEHKNVIDSYKKFEEENGYLPEFFNPYNNTELKDTAPTITQMSDRLQSSGSVCILQRPHGYNEGTTLDNCPSITKSSFQDNNLLNNGLRIRKLTPLEVWRLMGIKDEHFHKASKVVSNSQLYKQAGNAIVVDVYAAILKQLF